jgi:hypothetical protein
MDQHFGGWWNGVFAQTLHRALSQAGFFRRPLLYSECTLRADHAGLRGSGGVGLVLAWWGRRGRRRRGPSLRDTTLPTGRVVDRPETERPIIDKKLLKRKRLFFFFGLFAMSLRRSATFFPPFGFTPPKLRVRAAPSLRRPSSLLFAFGSLGEGRHAPWQAAVVEGAHEGVFRHPLAPALARWRGDGGAPRASMSLSASFKKNKSPQSSFKKHAGSLTGSFKSKAVEKVLPPADWAAARAHAKAHAAHHQERPSRVHKAGRKATFTSKLDDNPTGSEHHREHGHESFFTAASAMFSHFGRRAEPAGHAVTDDVPLKKRRASSIFDRRSSRAMPASSSSLLDADVPATGAPSRGLADENSSLGLALQELRSLSGQDNKGTIALDANAMDDDEGIGPQLRGGQPLPKPVLSIRKFDPSEVERASGGSDGDRRGGRRRAASRICGVRAWTRHW